MKQSLGMLVGCLETTATSVANLNHFKEGTDSQTFLLKFLCSESKMNCHTADSSKAEIKHLLSPEVWYTLLQDGRARTSNLPLFQ